MTTTDRAPEAPARPARRRWWSGLRRGPRSLTLVVLVLLVVAFTLIAPDRFLSAFNVRSIAIDASAYLVLAVGMTFVMITAGIDLSVGSVLVFSGVVGLLAMQAVGGSGWVTILVGLAVCLLAGTAWGALNGLLVTKGDLPPLIVTLGTFAAAYGASLVLTDGSDLRGVPAPMTDVIGFGRLGGVVPWPVVIAVVVTIVGALLLRTTRFGRHTCAIGSDVEAARRAGIRVDRHLVRVYALSGLLAGLAGWVSLARFATTTIAGHQNDNLQAIIATVLGGTSLFGGVGSVVGTALGSLIPATLNNGLVIAGLQPFWQQVAVGAVLIAVVYVDRRARRRRVR